MMIAWNVFLWKFKNSNILSQNNNYTEYTSTYLYEIFKLPAIVITIVIITVISISIVVVVVIITVIVVVMEVGMIVLLRIWRYTVPVHYQHPSSWKVGCSLIFGWHKPTDIVKKFIGFAVVSCWVQFIWNIAFPLQINNVPKGSNDARNLSVPVVGWNWKECRILKDCTVPNDIMPFVPI